METFFTKVQKNRLIRGGFPIKKTIFHFFSFVSILCHFSYNLLKMKELINLIQLIKFGQVAEMSHFMLD